MNRITLFLLTLFFFRHSFAQTGSKPNNALLPCNCNAIENIQLGLLPDEIEARQLLGAYMLKLTSFTKIKLDEPIIVKMAACGSPQATICPTQLPNGAIRNVRLILYNNKLLERLNKEKKKDYTLVDKQILLHELGHQVLGHIKDSKSVEALNSLFSKDISKEQLRALAKYGSSNPLAQELEADIFSIWALSKIEPAFDISQLIKQFDPEEIKKLDIELSNAAHSDHPLFSDRIKTMENFQEQMRRRTPTYPPRKYFADIASTAYLELWPDRPVYELYLSGGMIVGGFPMFKVEKEKVNAFLYAFDKYPNFQIGLSFNRFRWNKPLQTSLEINWSRQQYGTILTTNDGNKLAEKLQFNYLTLCPQVGWNSTGVAHQKSLRSLRVGFIANIGINMFVPMGKPAYTNYIASTHTPTIGFSALPKLSVGLALLKKSFLPRGFKWLLSYEPQWIRLAVTPKPTAISHNFTTTFQYAIVRR